MRLNGSYPLGTPTLILTAIETGIIHETPPMTERTHTKKGTPITRHARVNFYFPGMTQHERGAVSRIYRRVLSRGQNLLKRARL